MVLINNVDPISGKKVSIINDFLLFNTVSEFTKRFKF